MSSCVSIIIALRGRKPTMKFGQLKSLKWLTPDVSLGAYSAPIPPTWNKGDLLLRERDGIGRDKGGYRGDGKEREGREGGEGVKVPPVSIFKF